MRRAPPASVPVIFGCLWLLLVTCPTINAQPSIRNRPDIPISYRFSVGNFVSGHFR
jgi:hypothetical protein